MLNLSRLQTDLDSSLGVTCFGKITSENGGKITVSGLKCQVGDTAITGEGVRLECVGFEKTNSFFMHIDSDTHIMPGDTVRVTGNNSTQEIPEDIIGRVIDSYGVDLSGKKADKVISVNIGGGYLNPLDRPPIKLPLNVGVKSINGILSMGRGQRSGIIAGSGVGKSVLLGMMTRFTSADIVVVGLVGERGREVQDFIDENLNDDTRKKCIIVVETAEASPIRKTRSAELATSIAEKFRNEGKDVLLLIDSITRYANAYREIYLSAGEMPVSRGYPPSVFSKIYSIIERSGCYNDGTITAIYTILVDGDNIMDPIADHCRGILDGHIVLSRNLADSGIYPAIDISKSVSRIMNRVTMAEHQKIALKIKSLYATYNNNRDLISMGYEHGSDVEIDASIRSISDINNFLSQHTYENFDLKTTLGLLKTIFNHVSEED